MAKSMNSVNLTGYLGGDPRYHQFDNGDEVCNLSLAVARQKKQDGQYVDSTLWVDVKVFGGQAKPCSEYLHKGSFVGVSGALGDPRQWTDDNGATRFSIVIDRASVTFGPRTDGQNSQTGGGQAQQQESHKAPPAQQGGSKYGADDDIPW